MTTLIKDPVTGMMTPMPGDNTQVPTSQQVPDDKYTRFNMALMGILKDAQSAGSTAPLYAAQNKLKNESLNLSNPMADTPYKTLFSGMGSAAVPAEQGTQAAFDPGITSITDQIRASNDATAKFTDMANTALTTVQTLMPHYDYQLNKETGRFDGYNPKTGKWASQENPPVENDPTGSTIPTGSTGKIADNNNPLNIKLTDYSSKLFSALNPSLGSTATDGGNFAKFNNPVDGLKAARLLLQSPLYANDTVDQAMTAWSGGGYNSGIVSGTGINPHSKISELDGPQIDLLMSLMRKAEGTPTGTTAPATSGNLIDQYAGLVTGNSGMSFDDALAKLTPDYGVTASTRLMDAIHKINPDFNINQSNAQADAQTTNTKLAGDTSALVDKTNATLDTLPKLFEKLSSTQKMGGFISGLSGATSEVYGRDWKTNTDNFNRALAEARASANSVLSTAANLGVVTGGKTADSLLPDNMNEKGLTDAIAQIKHLEELTKTALANLSNAKGGSTNQGGNNTLTKGVTKSGISYTIS